MLSSMLNEKKYKPLEGYLSISEAAKAIGKTRQATYRLIKRYKIQVHKAGTLLVIDEKDLGRLR